MKILFYVDPIVEGALPDWKAGWLWSVRSMMLAIIESQGGLSDDLQFVCICSDIVEPIAVSLLPNCTIHAINAAKLVPALASSSLELAMAWSAKACDIERSQKMANVIEHACGDFVPDACITFSPAPFLRVAFPESALLHRENGMFSIPPFASTIYLDSAGMQTNSTVYARSEEILSYQPTDMEHKFLATLRDHYAQRLFGDANPLKHWAQRRLRDYPRAVLLALQAEGFYSYAAYASFPSQFDLLVHLLDSVPTNVAVICTEHPRFPAVPESAIRSLQSKYPNLLWDPVLRNVDGASQYLMEYVDTVITVSSSIGFQALLWHKQLIVAGSSQLDFVASSHDVRDAAHKGKIENMTADRVLSWLLTRYFLPTTLLDDGSFLMARLAHEIAISKLPAGQRTEPPVPELSVLTSAYLIQDVKNEESYLGEPGASAPTQIAVFTAEEEEEFSDSTCFTYRASILQQPQLLRLVFPVQGRRISRLRIDPSTLAEVFETREISVIGDDSEMLWTWRTGQAFPTEVSGLIVTQLKTSTLLVCTDNDPHFSIDWNASRSPRRTISVEIDISRPDSVRRLAESEAATVALTQELSHKESELRRQERLLEREIGLAQAHLLDFARERANVAAHEQQLQADLAALRSKLHTAQLESAVLRNSLSWRVTAPLRQIRRLLS
ncbi:hypothetical protein [Paraburkholderia sp. BL9I2N2]|uniref:capsular polysaccharide export protein, LipB/KpsS family n=1 Tax=Paraburkholderia sp. BL9I2N2 TaxID=1938809 RepID=UPI0010533030|nr:hypothetical protein [Paraburkholderia sp. BL9I2N2]TCK96559.1 capsular polysaccharide biosynthesis protein [Paraburkholderia sp. BL9I2N2]